MGEKKNCNSVWRSEPWTSPHTKEIPTIRPRRSVKPCIKARKADPKRPKLLELLHVHLHFLYMLFWRGQGQLRLLTLQLFVFPRSESLIIPESSLVVHLLNVYCTMSSDVCNTLHGAPCISKHKASFLTCLHYIRRSTE